MPVVGLLLRKNADPRGFRVLTGLICLLALVLSACKYETLGPGISASSPNPTPKQAAAKTTAARGQTPVPCRLADLVPDATWSMTNAGLVGTLALTNYWETPCTLQVQPRLGIIDETGFTAPLNTVYPSGDAAPALTLQRGASAVVGFTWRNYCGVNLSGDLRLTVMMPGQAAPALYVQIQDPNGRPRRDTPRCERKDQPSTLTVERIKVGNP